MVQAITSHLTAGLQLARQNYISTIASITALAGVAISGTRYIEHKRCRAHEKAAAAIKEKLQPKVGQLTGWRDGGQQLAKDLKDHLGDESLSAFVRAQIPFWGHPMFSETAEALRTLEEKVAECQAQPQQFFSEKKEAALTWLEVAQREAEAALQDKAPETECFAEKSSYLQTIRWAKGEIRGIADSIQTLKETMVKVKDGRKTAGFEEEDALNALAANQLVTDHADQKKIGGLDLVAVKEAINKLENLDAYEAKPGKVEDKHLTAKKIARATALQQGGIWKPALWLAGTAALILAANHGLPVALGQQHRIVQVLKLPR